MSGILGTIFSRPGSPSTSGTGNNSVLPRPAKRHAMAGTGDNSSPPFFAAASLEQVLNFCISLYNTIEEEKKYSRSLELRILHLSMSLSRHYIRICMKGVSTLAMLDSGSDDSYIPVSYAQKVGLSNIMDTRFKDTTFNIAKESTMLGRIHLGSFKVECNGTEIECETTFSICNTIIDVILGVEFLRRYACVVDFVKNRINFNFYDNEYAELMSYEDIATFSDNVEANGPFEVDVNNVNELITMGFDETDALNALKKSINNVPCAVEILFKNSMKFSLYEASKIENKIQKCSEALPLDACRELNEDKLSKEIHKTWKLVIEEFDKVHLDDNTEEGETFINDPSSTVAKYLLLRRRIVDKLDRMREEAVEKIPESLRVHPLVRISINGIRTLAIVDSGAESSVISLSFAIDAGFIMFIDTMDPNIFEGFGGEIRAVGSITRSIKIEQKKIGEIKFEVIDMTFKVILGRDFLQDRCTLDFARNRLIFQEKKYAAFVAGSLEEWRCVVKKNSQYSGQKRRINK